MFRFLVEVSTDCLTQLNLYIGIQYSYNIQILKFNQKQQHHPDTSSFKKMNKSSGGSACWQKPDNSRI
ncbi:hypothetical protein L1887_22536 [Cichorium endivia]|nr:hypothetical protein L1887_22536 [Cichorium endivia]